MALFRPQLQQVKSALEFVVLLAALVPDGCPFAQVVYVGARGAIATPDEPLTPILKTRRPV